jgi:hypothetical protein
MTNEIDRALSRRDPARSFLRVLFCGAFIGLCLVLSREDANAEPPTAEVAAKTVQVPASEMQRLQVEYAQMREIIDKLQTELRKTREMAGACYVNNSWSGMKWR